MSSKDIAVSVRGLSKAYTIAHNAPKHTMIGEMLMHRLKHPLQRAEKETYWALKDVEFDIQKGDVVGIIGRNGAGKSTLLKILSRITQPTKGQIDLYGRVGSLLEVGTGFHPELTGRENIFLNGAILGMRKREIARQFDAIVEFSEVEQFLDTPVKRYSSGMYVRLAFAVAAHLNPEILIVDEVLAVGDAEFQNKCLGKMGEVAQSGRTVLFVSHNMQAVQSLCSTAIQIESGRITQSDTADAVVANYLKHFNQVGNESLWNGENAPGNDKLRLYALRVRSQGGSSSGVYSSSKPLQIEIEFDVVAAISGLCVGFDLCDASGNTVFRSYQTDLAQEEWPSIQLGRNFWTCDIPPNFLNANNYFIYPRIGIHNVSWIVHIEAVVQFEIVLDHGVSPLWNVLSSANRPGVTAPILQWNSASR